MALIPVASERQDMEGERIEMVSCEAYTSTASQEFGIQVHLSKQNVLLKHSTCTTSFHCI